MSKFWIKLYHEILDDPKMGRLEDNIYRRAIESFVLAGEYDRNGELPSVDDMAWRLRIDPFILLDELEELENRTNIVHHEGETWYVTNFTKRQDPATDAERKQYQRQRDRKQRPPVTKRDNIVTGNSHVAVQDIDIDIDTDIDGGGGKPPAIFELYESQIGMLNQMIAEELKQAEKDYPGDWIQAAFREAARNNARSWNYIDAILRRWKAAGTMDTGRKKGKSNGQETGTNALAELLQQVERDR